MIRRNVHRLLLGLLCLGMIVACSSDPMQTDANASHVTPAMMPPAKPVMQMLKAAGMDPFGQVTRIQFTFNVKKRNTVIQRKWVWEPRTNRVTMTHNDSAGNEVTLSYLRDDVANNPNAKPELVKADRAFINDSFWLLPPLHLSWQPPRKLSVADHGMVDYPLSDGRGRLITVQFPAADAGGGGYTPGDRYDLYLGDDNLIHQWSYHKGGRDKPNLTVIFENYRQLGPLKLSLKRVNPNGFKLWFTDVKVDSDM